jgi:hypothetical protein
MALVNLMITNPSVITTERIIIESSGGATNGLCLNNTMNDEEVCLKGDNVITSYELFFPPTSGMLGEVLTYGAGGNLIWDGSGGGSVFDQTLNTTDSVTFVDITLNNSLIFNGSSSGTLTHLVSSNVTSHTLMWPSAVGSLGQALTTDASGNLSWTTVAGVGNPSLIADSIGGDTKIETEVAVNTLTFTTAGVQRMTIGSSGIVDFNLGTIVNLNNTTQSNSISSGSLIVSGGLGLAGNLNVGENVSFDGRVKKKVRTSMVNTFLDDDYILNTNAAITVTLPNLTNSIYDGVTYIIIKLSTDSVILDTATVPDKILFGGLEVNFITMSGVIGERITITSNGDKWHLI